MYKALAIMAIYPKAVPMEDFIVRDDSDGKGEYIDVWNLSEPIPTDDELYRAWVGYLKKDKLKELSEACQKAIYSGFTGSNGHSYQFEEKDQGNIGQQLTLLLLDPTINSIQWKTKNAGIVVHTRAEFIALANDANNHKRSNMGKYWQLEYALAPLSEESEIAKLVW